MLSLYLLRLGLGQEPDDDSKPPLFYQVVAPEPEVMGWTEPGHFICDSFSRYV